MKKDNKPVLFVSHMSDNSGAPLIFLNIIREFKKQTDRPFSILLMQEGSLATEFRSLGPSYTWIRKSTFKANLFIRLTGLLFGKIHNLLRRAFILWKVKDSSLVVFNTISNGHIHKKLLFLKAKHVCYVHEMEASIHILTNTNSLDIVLRNTDHFFAGSKAVKQNLIDGHRIAAEKIDVVYSSLAQVAREKHDHCGFIKEFRLVNCIPGDAIIIGVAASNEWRKGFDFFFPLVSAYFTLYPGSNVYFAWKGFREKRNQQFYDHYDQKRFNDNHRVLLLPHDGNSIPQMACFDIHLLLSREDPYPLVVLEAASFGIPTVSFLNAGGSPEFIENDCGFCVPYGNLVLLAHRLNDLVKDPDLRKKMGIAAKEKVKSRHDAGKTTREVIKILESI